jgi:adenine phosphoribosyltransferase
VLSLEEALGLVRTVPDFPSPGVQFRDLNPVLASPEALGAVIDAMAALLPRETELVAGIEARGFLLGGAVAIARGCGVVPIRKPGKLPVVADRVDYTLEYGTATLELPDVPVSGAEVVVVDDVLATGGTVAATCELLTRAGATVTAVVVVAELAGLGGRKRLDGYDVRSLVEL